MKNKLNIMKEKSPVTEDEIKSYMNYDEVLLRHTTQFKPVSLLKRAFNILAPASLIAVTVYLLVPKEPSLKTNQKTSLSSQVTGDSMVLDNQPEDNSIRQEIVKSTDEVKKKPLTTPKGRSNDSKVVANPIEIVRENDYHEAEPVAGYPHLYEYFNRELRYPKDALKDSVQGTVSVIFTLDKEGLPVNIIIQNSLGPQFDEESIRIIRNMPAWKPALLNGKPVPAKISVPLMFSIVRKPITR